MSIYTHTVFFKLKHSPLSGKESRFFDVSSRILPGIPGVQNFRIVDQKSPRSEFDFGFVMDFRDEAAHKAYNDHPDHQAYVEEYWFPNVESFQEIDFSPRN